MHGMTTTELINYLRSFAHYANSVTETDRSKLYQAADRLEELDRREVICPYCTERMEGLDDTNRHEDA